MKPTGLALWAQTGMVSICFLTAMEISNIRASTASIKQLLTFSVLYSKEQTKSPQELLID
ncbi:hypothetical protein BON23_3320 [Saccharomyces cerevisiae]|nr:hypothetical protein BON23_3320 [Saccharomyces cerevisiae]